MRNINMFKATAAATLIMLGSMVAAHAQTPASAAKPSVAASCSSDKQACRAANRKLQKVVLHSLSQTHGLSSSNILVVARGSVVTLVGSVPKAEQIELAVSVAGAVSGVSEVRNDLTIRPEGQ